MTTIEQRLDELIERAKVNTRRFAVALEILKKHNLVGEYKRRLGGQDAKHEGTTYHEQQERFLR